MRTIENLETTLKQRIEVVKTVNLEINN